MQSYLSFSERVDQAAGAILGEHPGAAQIRDWSDQFRHQCEGIQNGRGVNLPSIAVVGAKGQGKTWVARQLVLDPRMGELLPSGVLSSEATTQLYWIGPSPPESLDSLQEVYIPCRKEGLLDLGIPYLLLDTPGLTDDNPKASQIAKEALSLSPIKLLVVRRDQLRGAVLGTLAHYTEGAICLPIITCVPPEELQLDAAGTASRAGRGEETAIGETAIGASLQADLEIFDNALRGVAPGTRFLPGIVVEDFEATGDEAACGLRLRREIQSLLQSESMEQIAATRSNRLEAAKERYRSKIAGYVQENLGGLSNAIRTLHQEADACPSKTLETVLGSPEELHAAIRGRFRAHILTETSLFWFPYRTVMSILSFTTGAWDRLILSFTGSLPSIFGTFLAWAKNLSASRNIQRELHDGIRERLNRQIEDRLQPVQDAFYRQVQRLGGESRGGAEGSKQLKIRFSGIDELQNQARTTFEWCVDRELPSRMFLQFSGLLGTLLFWGMLAGPVVAIYRKYFKASWNSLVESKDSIAEFDFGSGVMLTSTILSALPLLLFCMLLLSWMQRSSKIRRIGRTTISAEHKLLEDLRNDGVLKLYYEDPLLEHAEFLVGTLLPSPRFGARGAEL